MVWKTLPLWAGIAAALAALGAVLVSELRLQGTHTAAPPSRIEGDLVLTGFRLSTLRDGVEEWEISAARARVFERDHRAFLDGVRGTVRLDDGSTMTFEGETAVFDTESRDLQLSGGERGAVVALPSGYALRTASLHWVHAQGELVSDDAVELRGPGLAVQGVGVRIRPATQELTILNRVEVDVS